MKENILSYRYNITGGVKISSMYKAITCRVVRRRAESTDLLHLDLWHVSRRISYVSLLLNPSVRSPNVHVTGGSVSGTWVRSPCMIWTCRVWDITEKTKWGGGKNRFDFLNPRRLICLTNCVFKIRPGVSIFSSFGQGNLSLPVFGYVCTFVHHSILGGRMNTWEKKRRPYPALQTSSSVSPQRDEMHRLDIRFSVTITPEQDVSLTWFHYF